MATEDLSSLIKETLYSTLEVTLSTPIHENEIFTCNQDCLNDKNIVAITSTFTFENLTTNIDFIFPAYFASYTFNTMMMEEAEPSLEIDDDIADALKEVAAQISGSLETAINGLDSDTLGSCKYSAGDVQVLLGDNFADISNLILITFTTNEKDFEIFINFDDEIAPYISEFLEKDLKITQIAPLKSQEDESSEENNEESKEDENTDDSSSETNDSKEEKESSITDTQDNNKTNEDENNEEQKIVDDEDELENSDLTIEEDEEEVKKAKKLKIAIIALASLLGLVLIAFGVLFYIGYFDPAPVKKHVEPTVKPSPQDLVLANIKNKQITYHSDLINVKLLNRRLSALTKYEILETDVLEEYKKLEKERLYKLKMKSLEEFALKNKEESIFKKDLITNSNTKTPYRFGNDDNNSIQYKMENELVTLIQIDALIYNKYSKVINQEKTKSTAISMCKNKDDKTYVYIGPLYINTLINNIIKRVGKKDAKLLQIRKKEFDKMCDF